MQIKKSELKIKTFIILTLAGVINAFGVTIFLAPMKLYDSGISGASMLLSQITPELFSLSFFLIILNVPLFLYGLKRQGIVFTIYSLYAVIIYSVGAWLITDILPIDVSIASPLAGQDLLLCALFGGLISGVGSGLVIRCGGAIDGVDVLAVIFAKRMGITVGTFVMTFNVILYIISGIVIQSWILPLYSIVAYGAALKTVDFISEGFDRSKAAMIVTVCPDEICAAITENFASGITRIEAKGGYSGTDRTMLHFVLNRYQISRLKNIVHELDPTAYITLYEVADIFRANQNQS